MVTSNIRFDLIQSNETNCLTCSNNGKLFGILYVFIHHMTDNYDMSITNKNKMILFYLNRENKVKTFFV